MSNRKVIVEFYSEDDAERFLADVRHTLSVASTERSFILRDAKAHKSQAHNEVSGNATGNVVQCQNIDGGVHL